MHINNQIRRCREYIHVMIQEQVQRRQQCQALLVSPFFPPSNMFEPIFMGSWTRLCNGSLRCSSFATSQSKPHLLKRQHPNVALPIPFINQCKSTIRVAKNGETALQLRARSTDLSPAPWPQHPTFHIPTFSRRPIHPQPQPPTANRQPLSLCTATHACT